MNKKTRTILFYLLLVIFLIVTPQVILYSQGYRFDWENKTYVETGGLYIKTYPSETNVLLNSEFETKTAGFSRDSFIQNLMPGKYTITLEKEGYSSWQKTLDIEKRKVTEIKDVVLFPKENEFNSLIKGVDYFFPVSQTLSVIEKNNAIYIYDKDKQEQNLIKNNENILDAKLFNNNILVETQKNYLIIDTQKQSATSLAKISQENVMLDNNGNVFYQLENIVLKNNTILKRNIDFFSINDDTLYYVIGGILYKEDEPLSETAIKIESGKSYEIIFAQDKIFLNKNNQELYLLKDESFEKILDLQNYFECRVWNNKILINTGKELWIFLLKTNYYPFNKEEGELILLSRFSEDVKDIYWLNNEYFIFSLENNIKISEIDNRDVLNQIDLANFTLPEIYYSEKTETLYVISSNNVYYLNKLVP